MQIFHYDQITGAICGTDVARESPLEPGIPLIPAYATQKTPPTVTAGNAAVFQLPDGSVPADGAAGSWSLIPDHRGEQWYKPDGTAVTIVQVGIPDSTWTQTAPVKSAAQLQSDLQTAALIKLDKATGPSGTIMRCVVAGVAVPVPWTAYVQGLRAIANGTDKTSTALPTQPPYPANT